MTVTPPRLMTTGTGKEFNPSSQPPASLGCSPHRLRPGICVSGFGGWEGGDLLFILTLQKGCDVAQGLSWVFVLKTKTICKFCEYILKKTQTKTPNQKKMHVPLCL